MPTRKDLKDKIKSKNYTIGFQVVEKDLFESLLEKIYGPNNPGSNPPNTNELDALVICLSEPPIVPWP